VISKVDGVLWDLDRPLEKSCSLQLLKFDDDEGNTLLRRRCYHEVFSDECFKKLLTYQYFLLTAQAVFWHSTAHILGEAMERVYGGCLCYGPPIESGYYYDMFLADKQVCYTSV